MNKKSTMLISVAALIVVLAVLLLRDSPQPGGTAADAATADEPESPEFADTRLSEPPGAGVSTEPAGNDSTPAANREPFAWRVTIPLETVVHARAAVPEQPIRELYAAMTAGDRTIDAGEAFYLYRALRFCQAGPTTQSEYDAQLLELLSTRKISGIAQVDDTTSAETLLWNKFELCDGVTGPIQARSREFLETAARGGKPEAQVLYANEQLDRMGSSTPPEAVESALAMLGEAKQQGNADAYFWSGFYGLNGLLDEQRTIVLANLVVADAAYSDLGMNRNIEDLINREYERLHPAEREQVVQLAREMAVSETCCSLLHGKTWEQQLSVN